MKILEGTLTNGKKVTFNADRIDAIIEHGMDSKLAVICFGAESYEVIATYDEIMKSGIRGKKETP